MFAPCAMSGIDLAIYLDVNVLIAIVEGRPLTSAQSDFLKGLVDGPTRAATSELSVAECLVKPYREQNAPAVAAYLEFLSGRPEVDVLPISRTILMRAARVRADSRLKLPDAIHLATAIEAGCAAFITNDRDFKAADAPFDMVRWDRLA